MENDASGEQKVQKQAAIIDSIFIDLMDSGAAFSIAVLATLGLGVISGMELISSLAGKVNLLHSAGSIFGVFCSTLGLTVSIYRKRAKTSPEQLSASLTARGYEVSFLRTEDLDWQSLSGKLLRKADEKTTTFLYYSGHGTMENGTSKINNGNLSDDAFLSDISKIPGKKIIAIDACMADGFISSIEKLSDAEKEKLVVVSASKKKITSSYNPMNKIVAKIAANSGTKPFIEEFNYANSKVSRFKKFITCYSPNSFVGKKMALARI